MADGRRIENHFLAITRMYIEIMSEEAESHAEEGQVIKMPNYENPK